MKNSILKNKYRPGRLIKTLVLISLCCLGISACSLFSPREPEAPNRGRSTFIPATSPALVLDNLRSCIQEKNPDNFILCLSDTSRGTKRPYQFEPNPEAGVRFGSFFNSWSLYNERTALQALISRIPPDLQMNLELSNILFDVISPDSAVIFCDYMLNAPHTVSTIPQKAIGRARFVMIQQNGGQWCIQRWTDNRLSSADSSTWSIYKAQFSN
jgi:hypothetical protein